MKSRLINAYLLVTSKVHSLASIIKDDSGEIATETLGKIIVSVVAIGIVIAAIKVAFPDLMSNILNQVSAKLSANWS